MALRLGSVMRSILEGWRQDLDPAWAAALGDVDLGFDAIDPALELELWEPIFPARRGRNFPGAPKGSHMLRAFDGIAPGDVRVVILGQDPYPCPAFSTGRAFEAGNVARWRELEKMFSCSFRTLLQLLAAARSNDDRYAVSTADWARTIDAIEAGKLRIPPATEIADQWVRQGVLLLNTGLTLTRFAVEGHPHQRLGHLPLWQPLIDKVLRYLLAQAERPIIFLGFGDTAADAFAAVGLHENETPIDGIAFIQCPHPAKGDQLLQRGNPFLLVNQALAAAHAAPIAW